MAFDESKVPEGPAADWFYNGRTGEGLTDEAYDETKARFIENELPLPWEQKEES